MDLWVFVLAAVLLSLERICYIYIWKFPESFRSICSRPAVAYLGEPIQVLEKLSYCFKGIQAAVFLGWCYFYGDGCLLPLSGVGFWLGVALIVVGQILNLSVFYRLGKIGVFYGNKLGYKVPWCRRFPFSFLAHPQYVGALLSIWGFFLVMRFPHGD
jgi:methylene-fatty-acyl-phospholipid synthase